MPYKNKSDLYSKQKQHRQNNRVNLCLYLLDHPCNMCGENDIRVLEFDHLDPSNKSYDIGRAVSGSHRSWNSILKEISKCQVLCANCHRKKTIGEPLWFTDIISFSNQAPIVKGI